MEKEQCFRIIPNIISSTSTTAYLSSSFGGVVAVL
jgi:hypothetical protein